MQPQKNEVALILQHDALKHFFPNILPSYTLKWTFFFVHFKNLIEEFIIKKALPLLPYHKYQNIISKFSFVGITAHK